MALIRCNECGQLISDRAMICPNCGSPLKANLYNQSASENTVISKSGDTYSGRPATPAPRPSGNNKGIIYGLSALIAILIGGILYVMLKDGSENTDSGLTQEEILNAKNDSLENELKLLEQENIKAEKAAQEEAERREAARQEAARRAAEAAALVSGSWSFEGVLHNEQGGQDNITFYLDASSSGSCSGSFNNYSHDFYTNVSGTMTSNSFNVRGGAWRFKGNRAGGNRYNGTASNGTITYRLDLTSNR